jgi:hypothetical protein
MPKKEKNRKASRTTTKWAFILLRDVVVALVFFRTLFVCFKASPPFFFFISLTWSLSLSFVWCGCKCHEGSSSKIRTPHTKTLLPFVRKQNKNKSRGFIFLSLPLDFALPPAQKSLFSFLKSLVLPLCSTIVLLLYYSEISSLLTSSSFFRLFLERKCIDYSTQRTKRPHVFPFTSVRWVFLVLQYSI